MSIQQIDIRGDDETVEHVVPTEDEPLKPVLIVFLVQAEISSLAFDTVLHAPLRKKLPILVILSGVPSWLKGVKLSYFVKCQNIRRLFWLKHHNLLNMSTTRQFFLTS